MTELLEAIGHNIRRLRDEKGWNQTELGFRAGASPSIISLIENGKRNPSTATLAKIAEALGVEVVDLFPKGSNHSPYEPTFNDVLAEERHKEAGTPMPEASGRHISVRIADNLSTEPARVEITYEAFLDVLRRRGLTRRAAKEAFEEFEELQRSA